MCPSLLSICLNIVVYENGVFLLVNPGGQMLRLAAAQSSLSAVPEGKRSHEQLTQPHWRRDKSIRSVR